MKPTIGAISVLALGLSIAPETGGADSDTPAQQYSPRLRLPESRGLDRAKLAARIETLFERAANEDADVTFRAGTVGET